MHLSVCIGIESSYREDVEVTIRRTASPRMATRPRTEKGRPAIMLTTQRVGFSTHCRCKTLSDAIVRHWRHEGAHLGHLLYLLFPAVEEFDDLFFRSLFSPLALVDGALHLGPGFEADPVDEIAMRYRIRDDML